ncbi:uncharacterized protein LY79DRAFT_284471 [Colletotrichum navitas]|uniref:Uncharacterized protein n=1 Tax=Colletotrichum navitas TaxID=681940 RepID=A0AAD8V8I1_9PEZI|nr:uncharacterized protein LY79DRAFT_284471 [Colletotrichum navitas]KAK1598262.1 hypothetical protein LY79DRAFT_284471 [Colletotrichum navitas]
MIKRLLSVLPRAMAASLPPVTSDCKPILSTTAQAARAGTLTLGPCTEETILACRQRPGTTHGRPTEAQPDSAGACQHHGILLSAEKSGVPQPKLPRHSNRVTGISEICRWYVTCDVDRCQITKAKSRGGRQINYSLEGGLR